MTKSNTQLFNNHPKLSQESLKKVFLVQLNNIYCIKNYLVENLPAIAETASFQNLKSAIFEGIEEISAQILRMNEIYRLIGETYSPDQCAGIKGLVSEAYRSGKSPDMSDLEADLMLLYHMNMLESMEISSFTALHDIADSLPDDELSILLKQNLDIAKDNKELYELISKEYIRG